MFTTLIDGATLVSRGGEPGWIAMDCRAALGDLDYGRTAYREGHVPGARYADLDRDLAGPPGKRGRHPLPGREELADRFAAWGIRHGDQLVAYDDAGGQFACPLLVAGAVARRRVVRCPGRRPSPLISTREAN